MLFLVTLMPAVAQDKINLEVHGFIMLDAGYNFNSIDPDWFDVMRPTKLPAFPGEFGPSGSVYYSIRQTRLGFRTSTPTSVGEVKTKLDIDMFGFGADAGQTTFHVINAFAEIGRLGFGQAASAFMDVEAVPLTLDYWGPCSRTFNFNIQVRYAIIDNEQRRLVVALDRPNAKADGGAYRPQLELEDVQPQFLVPNFAMHYRHYLSWGHIQAGSLLKFMKWKDLSGANPYDLSGQDLGWGINASGVARVGNLVVIKTQAIYGEGVQNYFADAAADVGLQSTPEDPLRPFKGKALPTWGFYVFTEWQWNKILASTIGYGAEAVTNSDLQDPSAFRKGQYAMVNIRWYPVERVMAGVEYQFGRRDNHSDSFHSIGNKIQVSVKANFSSREL